MVAKSVWLKLFLFLPNGSHGYCHVVGVQEASFVGGKDITDDLRPDNVKFNDQLLILRYQEQKDLLI